MEVTETKTFYDEHPFDWTPSDASGRGDAGLAQPLADWIADLDGETLVVDIGCGPGRVLSFLAHRNLRCVGLDRSGVSVGIAVERSRRPGAVADNLQLPLANQAIGAVISDGVIHHTGDPESAFAENCRVLKQGGKMYLAVYKPFGRYPWLYKYPGAVVRTGLRNSATKPLVVLFFQLPYFLVHAVRTRGRRTWRGAKNLFYDYFVSPHVAFLSRDLVEQWCRRYGARIVSYHENPGLNVHSFSLARESSPAGGAAERSEEQKPCAESAV
jgi:SAM-dependent methyltransferase